MAADLVSYHIQQSQKANIANYNNHPYDASKLRAQGNLRLVIMSDTELQQLATLLNLSYSDISDVVTSLIDTSDIWVTDLLVPWETTFNTN